jgi:hypothetical protein
MNNDELQAIDMACVETSRHRRQVTIGANYMRAKNDNQG